MLPNLIWSTERPHKMWVPRPATFLDLYINEDVILEKGVNFASRGGVILKETGGLFVSDLKQLYGFIYGDQKPIWKIVCKNYFTDKFQKTLLVLENNDKWLLSNFPEKKSNVWKQPNFPRFPMFSDVENTKRDLRTEILEFPYV